MTSASIVDCVISDSTTKWQFHPLRIRRADGESVIPEDLPALETTLSMILGSVLTVEMCWCIGERGARSAVAWLFDEKSVEDALLMSGVMCVDIFFDFVKDE